MPLPLTYNSLGQAPTHLGKFCRSKLHDDESSSFDNNKDDDKKPKEWFQD